jgi:uncharacterized PurR-regulated membrane protein YhhQ (DUF165 family)
LHPPLLTVFTGLFVAVLVLIPSLSSKFIALGPVNLPAGTLIFPIAFILNTLLTEVYGYARTRLITWTAIGCQIFAALSYWIAGVWPSAPFWTDQAAYMTILGVAPRITLASFSAFFCGEFATASCCLA